MDNKLKKAVIDAIDQAKKETSSFATDLTIDKKLTHKAIVTPFSLFLYQNNKTDPSLPQNYFSVLEFNSHGELVSTRKGILKYTRLDSAGKSCKNSMTLEEKVKFDLAELLDDPSISDIYRLVKIRLATQKAKAQANYRRKMATTNKEEFKKNTSMYQARSQAKKYISITNQSGLDELKELIATREEELNEQS